MNIETLRTRSGAFRNATVADVLNCLDVDHVTHLENDRGIVAIRPYGSTVTIEFKSKMNYVPDSAEFADHDSDSIVRFVLRHLNGTANSFVTGELVSVYANQGHRDGYVLAVDTHDDKILVEYEMPKGTTALREIKVLGDRYLSSRTISYRKITSHWVTNMVEQDTWSWEGRGQTGRVPFPAKKELTEV